MLYCNRMIDRLKYLYVFVIFAGFCCYELHATEKSAQNLCRKYIAHIEQEKGIPTGLLAAISIIESGKNVPARDDLVAWPWVINVAGKPEFYKTKTDTVKALNKHLNKGVMNIDVGCMQLNYRYHGDNFSSVSYMLDPRRNVEYGAKFLIRLYDQFGSWTKAIGHYHSATLKHQVPYRHKVYKKWRKVRHDPDLRPKRQERDFSIASLSKQAKRLMGVVDTSPTITMKANSNNSNYDIIRPKRPTVASRGDLNLARNNTSADENQKSNNVPTRKPYFFQ